jgi:uncharacterized protein (DUF952 family)
VTIIYKICPEALWREAEREGVFRGTADDHRDGFIHFSTAEQLTETARKHFAGRAGLVLISVDSDSLGPALAWEPSRGRSSQFPHLYDELPLTAVERVVPLPLGDDGLHVIPDLAG